MRLVTHVNYTDQDGQIYCCLRNKVVKLDAVQHKRFCEGCKMFAGTAKGRGVECVWQDMRNVSEPHIVDDPIGEYIMNQTRAVTPDSWITTVSYCS
jgi:molybdenum cofactor biosynthesis enzyme MoaA